MSVSSFKLVAEKCAGVGGRKQQSRALSVSVVFFLSSPRQAVL